MRMGSPMVALLAAATSVVSAQDGASGEAEVDTVFVTDSADYYRHRSENVAPTLVYEAEYFARFEPLSAGDMLKQLPGVAFVSDIGEYEAPQLRGIGAEYTQVLINGQRVAGAGENRGVFVDRIPAELIERIEIIRSPQADVDSQGIGGSINIVLKEAAEYAGGQYRLGAFRAGEGTVRGSGYLGYGGQSGAWSYLGAVNLQERYNPKRKQSQAFTAPQREPDGSERQADVRDSRDLGANAALAHRYASGASLGLTGYYIGTDRDEDELTSLFDGAGEPDGVEYQHERIEENTVGVGTRWWQPVLGDGEFVVSADYDRLSQDIDNVEGEVDEGEIPTEREAIRIDDDETRLGSSLLWSPWPEHRLKLGAQLGFKQRDAAQRTSEVNDEGEFEDQTEADGVYRIDEDRIDVYAQDQVRLGQAFTLGLGLRLEQTSLDQKGFDSDGSPREASEDQTEVNPNAHLLWKLSARDQLRASVARSLRRPNFVDLVPFVIEDDGEFFVGNPALKPETALGYDLGFERRFARQEGVAGLNLFYRDLSDVIETTRIAEDTESPGNSGDGQIWGVELDASLPLVLLGLPSVNLYGNYSYLKSEIDDPFTGESRRFNNQPVYVYNIGFTHRLPFRITYGASYRQQGEAREQSADEVVVTQYDGNLEAFVEYAVTQNLSLKLSGTNLLDASKDERFLGYDDVRPDGVLESLEYETESVGRIAVLTLRGRF